ncbi:MAG: hypothetical protein COA79_09350 [Planctomycetota bacterium]|nr:MAG: hypothetical protein COA79_09350 [Planctomycetota bacterium]
MNKSTKIFFEEKFENGLENWAVEKWEDGDAVLAEVVDNSLHVKTDSKLHGTMIWCKQEIPENFIFEFDFIPNSDDGFFLIPFCCKGQDGSDILDEPLWSRREEETLFKKYVKGIIDGYHISFRRGDAANCNFRKNSGMALLKQEVLNEVLPMNQNYHVQLTKDGNHFILKVNDMTFMDVIDDESELGAVRTGGKLGLRQVYKSEGTYRNILIKEIL